MNADLEAFRAVIRHIPSAMAEGPFPLHVTCTSPSRLALDSFVASLAAPWTLAGPPYEIPDYRAGEVPFPPKTTDDSFHRELVASGLLREEDLSSIHHLAPPPGWTVYLNATFVSREAPGVEQALYALEQALAAAMGEVRITANGAGRLPDGFPRPPAA